MNGKTPLPYAKPLLDAVALFEELGIGYALVGGLASMVYGRARFTEDVDFVAVSTHRGVMESNPEAMRRHHFDPSCSWKLYHETGVEVDLWKDDYADAIVARSREVELAGRSVRIAEPHDLIAMKLRAGRLQDDYDISEIVRGPEPVDDETVRFRTTPEEFGRYLGIKARTK